MKKYSEELFQYATIVSAIMSPFANIIAFYLSGNVNEMVRKMISWGLIVTVAGFMIVYTGYSFWKSTAEVKKVTLIGLAPVFVNALLLVIALIATGGKSAVLKNGMTFGLYGIPLVCGGLYCVKEKKLEAVIAKVKWVAAVMMPFYVLAIISFLQRDFWTDTQKGYASIDYLSLGYMTVTVYSLLLCNLLFFKKKDKLVLTELAICSMCIFMASSRGAVVAWAFATVTALVIGWLKKRKTVMVGSLVGVIAMVLIIIVAPANCTAIQRQFWILAELKSGALTESLFSAEGHEVRDQWMQMADGERSFFDIVKDMREDKTEGSKADTELTESSETGETSGGELAGTGKPSAGTVTDAEGKPTVDAAKKDEVIYSITNGSMARSYLFQIAIAEGKKSPWFGMGPMGYQLKYATYPHNVLLETLSDYGVIAFVLLCGGLLLVVVRVLKKSVKSVAYSGFLLICSGEVIRMMLSGNLYSCPWFITILVVVIFDVIRQRRSAGEIIDENSTLLP